MENKICTLDIESSCLLSDAIEYSSMPYRLKSGVQLWCVVITDVKTLESVVLTGENLTADKLKEALLPYSVIITHNGFKFDLVKLMLFGLLEYTIGYMGQKDTVYGREVRLLDTLVMSRLINPDRIGGHSLHAWGERVGFPKTDYRGELIKLGFMSKEDPKGFEFSLYNDLMVDYCVTDTQVTAHTYVALMKEYSDYKGWAQALQQEHKLADLAIRRETLGFWFDRDLALSHLEVLTAKMKEIQERVNPILPKKSLTKGELDYFTPPVNQIKKDGEWSTHMVNFLNRLGITDHNSEQKYFTYKGNLHEIPCLYPLETEKEATVDDLDTVKAFLIELGWVPQEWKERDLTKDAKKQPITLEKREKALKKYCDDTLSGKYKEQRLGILGIPEEKLYATLKSKLLDKWGVKVPTSPCIKVGVTKEMCPNLLKLGETVSFAKDVADYYTYRHRKSAIAGGDIDEIDFDVETPNTGYLANCRSDGRISTPSIEVGASTTRYKHITVANVPRISSLFGKEMRSLFGAGKEFVQFGFDYASLEARIEGHYIYPYEGGAEMATSLLAEKPNDIHSLTAERLGIKRDDAKSVNYAILYGASANKFVKMLGYTKPQATKFVEDWWDLNSPLKQLKADKEREWMQSGKKYITSIDGRRINIRSQHSILNALFQSSGVIFAKYVTVLICQEFESAGICIDPFKGRPAVCSMIEYHDEQQQLVDPQLLSFKTFNTEEEATEFCNLWEGHQLGAVQKSSKGLYYVTLPSVVSETISATIRNVEEMFSIKVPMGYEYVTGRNWAECH